MYFVYLLLCDDGSLYTGITTDVARRFTAHQAGSASRYTRARGARKMVYVEEAGTKSDALRREAAIKRLSRAQKIALYR